MPVDQPFTIYRDQLTGLSHGLPLWNPNPLNRLYNRVSIGDVGYLDEGTFIRMFNVILPYDDPSNKSLGNPEPYDPLYCGPYANIIEVPFDKVDHYSRFVTAETNADPYDMETVTYKFRNRGALLSLPNGGHHEDTILTKVFEDYIRDHVDGWFNWAQNNDLHVGRIENLILVTGCTLVTSWAAVATLDKAAEISMATQYHSKIGASFVWSNVRGHVSYHNSRFDPQNPPTMADQCVFIRGLRAKRVRFAIRVIGIESGRDLADENALSFLGDDSQTGGSSSSSVYPEQLSALSHGLPLWNPNPPKRIYDRVSIGDVGYLNKGTFIRMFNVMLPWDHWSNGSLGYPETYDPLDCGPFANKIEVPFDKVDHYSRFVTAETNADLYDVGSVTYKFRNRGALLSLPNGGYHEDTIRAKSFEDYIRDHVDGWFNWAQHNKLGVERMEDLILVTGCTMVTSWAAAACVDNTFEAEISLGSRLVSNVGTSSVWSNVRGHNVSYNSRFTEYDDPSAMADQCVFIRGFRAKRVRFTIRVIRIESGRDLADENALSFLGDDSQIGGSSSSWTVYREQLSALVLSHGLPLWNPNPQKNIYDRVSIGDVGYMHKGTFIRMFNVTLPWDHSSNGLLGYPEPYDLLDYSPVDNKIEAPFDKVDHYSRFVTPKTNAGNLQAMSPDDMEGVTYKFRNRGALLSLPNGGYRQDVIRTKAFEDYIRDHVDKWFSWAQNNRLGVEQMEDLILVSGCTMVASWAAAACVDNTLQAEISLRSRLVSNNGASFVWSNVRGHNVSYHNSHFSQLLEKYDDPSTLADQCVFIRGFRAKRVLLGIRVIKIVSGADENSPYRKRNNRLRNETSFLGNSSSSLDINHENPRRSPYQRDSLDDSLSSLSHIWGSSSSLDTIRPINRDNPQHHPYPSSTTLQSNGSVYNASLMTSPNYDDSIIEVLNDIAEVRDEDTLAEDTTSIANDNDPSVR